MAYTPIRTPTRSFPIQEIRRLFGPVNEPVFDANARHCAILRKALELCSPADIHVALRQTKKLRMAMGTGATMSDFSKIKTQVIRTGKEALSVYLAAYDAVYKKQGNNYAVCDAARGMPSHPDWALQPLPGLERVRTLPRPQLVFPTPPSTSSTGGSSSPVRSSPLPGLYPLIPRTPVASTSKKTTHLRTRQTPIEISDSEDAHPRRSAKKSMKRKCLPSIIEISDSEDERPRKKAREYNYLGFIDLTRPRGFRAEAEMYRWLEAYERKHAELFWENGAVCFARMQAAMYRPLQHNTEEIFKSTESGAHHDWVKAASFDELVMKVDSWRDKVFTWMDQMGIHRVYKDF
ncbi:hypothetical protein DFH09DRAFT_1344563 [Mycena vulgaris]|nr:hypothetical protein DFH09DRAFT_1344563 [Mycena vulgaris]